MSIADVVPVDKRLPGLKPGDVVRINGLGEALWRISSAGKQTHYPDGELSWEDESCLVLFLPEEGLPREAYPPSIGSLRNYMIPVAAMEVIALTVAAPSEAAARVLSSKFKSRQKRRRQLYVQSRTFKKKRERDSARKKLKNFEKDNPDLLRVGNMSQRALVRSVRF